MTFDFPLRVRCIEGSSFFRRGEEYTVLRMVGQLPVIESEGYRMIGRKARFKPVVRRQAPSVRT